MSFDEFEGHRSHCTLGEGLQKSLHSTRRMDSERLFIVFLSFVLAPKQYCKQQMAASGVGKMQHLMFTLVR
jgi:hypothetical protein